MENLLKSLGFVSRKTGAGHTIDINDLSEIPTDE